MQLVVSNVVVVAKSFNPSIFSQPWLVRNGVVGEEEFLPGCVFVEGLSQVMTRSFDMLVVPDRLQFSPKAEPHGEGDAAPAVAVPEGELITDKVGKIIRTLPHTPYIAVGINFVWQEPPQGNEGISELSRRLFGNPHSAIHREFAAVDARFGTYMSKDISGGMRLKFDIKPAIVAVPTGGTEDRLVLVVNFHKEIAEGDRVQQVVDTVGRWNECKQQATALVELAVRGEDNRDH